MRYIQFFLISSFFFLGMSFSVRASNKEMGLNALLQHVVENNPSIQRERAKYYSVVESLAQAKSGYKPSLSINGSITHLDTTSSGNQVITQDGSNLSQSISADVSQPLFRGGSTLALINEQKEVATAQYWVLNRFYQDMMLETITAYWELYVQQAVLDLRIKNVERLGLRFKEVNTRYSVGQGTKTDVAQSSSRLASANAELEEARGRFHRAKAYLSRLTFGHDLPESIIHPDIIPDVPDDYAQALSDSLAFNPSLKELELLEKASKHSVNSVKGELLPQVDLGVSSSREYDPAPGFLEEQDAGVIKLTATIPLYVGGATRSRLRQAKYDKQATKYDLVELRSRVEEDMATVWSNYQSFKASFGARIQQSEAAKIAAEGLRKEYEYGVRTLIDLLDAEQEHLQSQVDLLNSEKDVAVSGFALARQLGALSPKNFGFAGMLDHRDVMNRIGDNWLGLGVDYPN